MESAPVYGSRYYAGGYPDDGYGVCTDVIHHAFSAAGYSLKQMVDADIASDPQAYGITTADPNIDFRRVDNLLVFFSRHAQQLSNRFDDPFDWQPGDIVIYHQHIGICSDRRSMQGYPLLIHFDPIGAGNGMNCRTAKSSDIFDGNKKALEGALFVFQNVFADMPDRFIQPSFA